MIYNYTYESPVGALCVCADDEALISLHYGKSEENTQNEIVRLVCRQLDEYFEGKRHCFDLPLKPEGTDFQKKVWSALRDIPYGETRSYGHISEKVGNSKACRAVGMANNRNPIAIIVPCHRVIGADGTLTGYAGGLNAKRFLLELENKNR